MNLSESKQLQNVLSSGEQVHLDVEIACLDDESLVDEVLNVSSQADLTLKSEAVLGSFFKNGKLSKLERMELESVYKLYYSKYTMWE